MSATIGIFVADLIWGMAAAASSFGIEIRMIWQPVFSTVLISSMMSSGVFEEVIVWITIGCSEPTLILPILQVRVFRL